MPFRNIQEAERYHAEREKSLEGKSGCLSFLISGIADLYDTWANHTPSWDPSFLIYTLKGFFCRSSFYLKKHTKY